MVGSQGDWAYGKNGSDRDTGFCIRKGKRLFLRGQDGFYPGMVGERGQRNVNHPPQAFREDPDPEHGGALFLGGTCRMRENL